MPLTDTAIRKAKPADKPIKLADEKGLFLLINANGAKYWRQKYRFNGKEKMLAHGVYPDVILKLARERRDAARRLLAEGIDPGETVRYRERSRKGTQPTALKLSPASGSPSIRRIGRRPTPTRSSSGWRTIFFRGWAASPSST